MAVLPSLQHKACSVSTGQHCHPYGCHPWLCEGTTGAWLPVYIQHVYRLASHCNHSKLWHGDEAHVCAASTEEETLAAERSDGGAAALLQEKIADAQRRLAAAEKSHARLRTVCMGAEQVMPEHSSCSMCRAAYAALKHIARNRQRGCACPAPQQHRLGCAAISRWVA